ncbi:MAG: 2-isopropylmalate synthase [Christensenellaceae bacterium]|nr:2-isopropylmalate synthase [Christensenellaceae bacterium]
MFNYDEVPKIMFNHRTVPMYFPDDIWITDTTFRDGQQSRAPFTVEQIVDLYKLMHKLGGPKGIVRQTEFFVYTQKDRDALAKCQDLGFEFPQITTWIRANKKDFELVKSLGIEETGILVSCSDYHIFTKMGLTRKQAMDKYLGIVKDALSLGIKPRCHFEDITRADFYGFVVPFANELGKLRKESGIPIKIRMCDTLGYGVSYPGASLPRSVQGIVYGLRFYSGFPSTLLEWHGHNDFYKVVTNAATAWLYGASSVNCSILGIGERTGNCPLEAMVMEYCSLKGTTDGMDLHAITEIAEYFERKIGYEIMDRTPFVGRNFNSTRAGIHADGLIKNEEIYNIFNTEKILGRPATVMIGEVSGAAGIAHWMNAHFKLVGSEKIEKQDELVLRVKAEVDREYAEGRTTSFGDEELEQIIRELDPERFFKLTHIMPM